MQGTYLRNHCTLQAPTAISIRGQGKGLHRDTQAKTSGWRVEGESTGRGGRPGLHKEQRWVTAVDGGGGGGGRWVAVEEEERRKAGEVRCWDSREGACSMTRSARHRMAKCPPCQRERVKERETARLGTSPFPSYP